MGDNAICTSLLRIDPNVHVHFLLDSPAFIETIKDCWMFSGINSLTLKLVLRSLREKLMPQLSWLNYNCIKNKFFNDS